MRPSNKICSSVIIASELQSNTIEPFYVPTIITKTVNTKRLIHWKLNFCLWNKFQSLSPSELFTIIYYSERVVWIIYYKKCDRDLVRKTQQKPIVHVGGVTFRIKNDRKVVFYWLPYLVGNWLLKFITN